MNYTSAEANKLLKKLNDEYTALLDKETRSRDFRAAMGEDVASVRPVYDYAETQARLAALEEKIRRLKHAINCFNTTHFVDGFDMTIDEMLVYIPQFTRRKNKLLEMKSRLPKERVEEQYGRRTSSTTATQTTTLPLWRRTMKRPPTSSPARSSRSTRSTGGRPSNLVNEIFPSFPYECQTILITELRSP